MGDITNIDISKLSKNITLLTHGSPCFTADTLVLTKEGYKNIIDVKVGDYVLDHTNQYNKVTNFFEQGKKKIWKVKPMCSTEIKTTENHRFLIKDKGWVECKDIHKEDLVGIAIQPNDLTDDYKILKSIKKNKLDFTEISTHFCDDISMVQWIVQYVAKNYHTICEVKQLEENKYEIIPMIDHDENHYENGYIWCPIKDVIETDEYEEVYDIEVENSHSLTANGVIAHNCQSFSSAGLQHGGDEGSGTRSSLMWNTVNIVKEIKPKIIIWENVKNVLSVKHKHNFDRYVDTLNEYGYNNYYKVINSKDHGVPQNRERLFVVSIRKDIDNGLFGFPKPYKLEKILKDLLDKVVDEKYYLSDKQIDRIKNSTYIQNQRRIQEKQWSDTLCARDWKDPKCVQVEEPAVDRMYGIFDTDKSKHQAGSVYNKEGLSPTLCTMQGGYLMSHVEEVGGVAIPEATKKGYKMAYDRDGVYINRPHQKHGCVQRDMIQTLKTIPNDLGVVVGTYQYAKSDKFMNGKSRFKEGKDYTDTIQTSPKEGVVIANHDLNKEKNEMCNDLRIRKLTPLECWRIMDFDDEDFYKAQKALNNTYYKGKDRSSSQLYKQAGNSIVVNVLYEILLELYKVLPDEFDDLNLLSLFSGIGSPEKALERLYKNVINKED